MKYISMILVLILFLPVLASGYENKVPLDAEKIAPLLIGSSIPELKLRDSENNKISLNEVTKDKLSIIIFYRGGWCPFCVKHLKEFSSVRGKLVKLGFKIFVISPDKPEKIKETLKKEKINYRLFSDSDMKTAKAFGIAFKVSPEIIEKYKGYGIDLKKASGKGHNLLPVPSVFLVDKTGKIVFTYVNPDYKTRLDSKLLLSIAESLVKK